MRRVVVEVVVVVGEIGSRQKGSKKAQGKLLQWLGFVWSTSKIINNVIEQWQ